MTGNDRCDILKSIFCIVCQEGSATKHQYLIHPFKFGVALCTVAVCAFLAFLAAAAGNWIAAVLFGAAAALFVFVAVLYGSTLTLDDGGLSRSFFGIPMRSIPWSDIAEVGVVGLKVFNNNDPNRPGTRYIYFSPRTLDKDSRFRLALEWPPRNMLYLCYTKERFTAVQALWNSTIETYNAGDVFYSLS